MYLFYFLQLIIFSLSFYPFAYMFASVRNFAKGRLSIGLLVRISCELMRTDCEQKKLVNLFKFRRIIFIYEGDYDWYHNRNSLLIQLIRKKVMTKK